MNILITSGTGTVGSQVTAKLMDLGHSPYVLTHSPEKAEKLPPGSRAVICNLECPESIPGAFREIDALCLITPLIRDEAKSGIDLVRAAAASGVKDVVFLSIHALESVRPFAKEIPHFKAKWEIQEEIERSGMRWTTIAPNNFYQNDFWFLDLMQKNSAYLQPIGEVGLSRVDTRDIAEAMANALVRPELRGEIFSLVGPEPITGTETALIYSEALGREIRYPKNAMEQWEAFFQGALPSWMLEDFKRMYRLFNERGLRATESEVRIQEILIGGPPRSFRDFVEEVTKSQSTNTHPEETL